MRRLVIACGLVGACSSAGPDRAPDEPRITIAACMLTPASIVVPVSGDFSFINQDDVDHVITGADGQVWVTATAHRASPLIGITKVGSWPFSVSGCPMGGTVVVE